MHHVRGASNLFFSLVLIYCIFFSVAYADDAINLSISTVLPELVNETINQTESSSVKIVTIEPEPESTRTQNATLPATVIESIPDPRTTDTILLKNAVPPLGTETTAPILSKPPGVGTVTTESTSRANVTETAHPVGIALPEGKETPSITQTDMTCSDVSSGSDAPCGSPQAHYPLMHLSKAELDEEEAQFQTIDKYSAPPLKAKSFAVDSITNSKSLLSYISYVPAERNQGYCGDCWVWASTGALEVDHAVKTGVNERLSTQYFNSKFNNGAGENWACCGGNIQTFTTWYNSDKTPIPWSNTNAAFGDRFRTCENYATAVPIGTISTAPHYNLNSISYSGISTTGVGQSTAIANIKSAIDNNKAVYYSFHFGNTGWSAFQYNWSYVAESVIFNPDSYGGEADAGGHGVLIVGYDSTDPSNPYWIVLNSWGAPSGRPNGLYRLKMDMNYDNYFTYGSYAYYQHKFYVLDAVFDPGAQTGVFRPSTHLFYLRPGNYPTTPATTINWGISTDIPVTGDWNGDGTTEVGVFRPSTRLFYLRPGNYPTTPATTINWGINSDQPVIGKW